MDLLEWQKEHLGQTLPMDVYGAGSDLPAVEQTAANLALPLKFHGAKDHGDPIIHNHKVRRLYIFSIVLLLI